MSDVIAYIHTGGNVPEETQRRGSVSVPSKWSRQMDFYSHSVEWVFRVFEQIAKPPHSRHGTCPARAGGIFQNHVTLP